MARRPVACPGFYEGIPPAGTMAHSYVMAFPGELEAFRAFARTFPRGTTGSGRSRTIYRRNQPVSGAFPKHREPVTVPGASLPR